MTRQCVSIVAGLGAAVLLAACSLGKSTGDDRLMSGGPIDPSEEGGWGAGGAGGKDSYAGAPSSVASSTTGSDAGIVVAGGQLTAADWDDNLNFGLFLDYAARFVAGNPAMPGAAAADRVVITVRDEAGAPLSNARVKVADAAGTRLEAPAGSDGRLLFFPGRDGAAAGASFTVTVQPPAGEAGSTLVAAAPASTAWSFVVQGATAHAPPSLDVALVVDVTGSMGDELGYLKNEIDSIASAVAAARPGVSVRYALVVYRDVGDDFVTRSFDFADLARFKANLAPQAPNGGGDYPEAVEEALAAARALSWRQGNVARVAFLVADAPPHTANAAALFSQANAARLAGIRLYPVGASGVADDAEYLFRLAAQTTLGRYLFLTDDSGIGGAHAEPRIPCYQVELLSKLMVRMIESELAGTRVPAAAADVVRSVGNPVGNTCTTADGGTAAF